MAAFNTGRAGRLDRSARYRGQYRLSRHHSEFRLTDPDDPVGRDLLRPDLREPDAGLRAGRRHFWPRPGVSRRPCLERRGIPAVRRRSGLWLAAVLSLSARDRRRLGDQRRAGPGDRAVSRAAAKPRSRRVHDDLRAEFCGRSANRRSVRRASGAGPRFSGFARRLPWRRCCLSEDCRRHRAPVRASRST